jgi:hypothetical protein
MLTSFIPRTLLFLIVIFAILSRLVSSIQAGAEPISTLPASEPYSLSYAAGGYDARGNFLGGTELMNLAAFEGKLYAGIGYWMDRPQIIREHPDPKSGAQILVLDAKVAQWRQENGFSEGASAGGVNTRLSTLRAIQFHRFDAAGNILGPLTQILVVGLDGANGTVYTQRSPGSWEDTRLPTPTPIRSLAVYYDPTDKTERLYAAPGGELESADRAVFSGVYDPSAPGRIRWNPTPEHIGVGGRVMSMTECNGALFAAARPSIFRRNDAQKSWEAIYSYPVTDPFDLSKYASGFRGLTCINGPDGKKTLLSGFEGSSGDILRIDPHTGAAVVELHTRQFLIQQWGSPPLKQDVIAGYNDIPAVKGGPGEIRLFGLLSRNVNEMNAAWVLSRTTSYPPRYDLHRVNPPMTWPHSRSDDALWSVRAIAVSPFPGDQGQVLYLGGYDGHFQPDHNTAWLDRVGVDTALAPYKQE